MNIKVFSVVLQTLQLRYLSGIFKGLEISIDIKDTSGNKKQTNTSSLYYLLTV